MFTRWLAASISREYESIELKPDSMALNFRKDNIISMHGAYLESNGLWQMVNRYLPISKSWQ